MDPNRPPWEPKNEPLSFDEAKLGKVKPVLGESEGFVLPPEELKRVFGIDPEYFGKLPGRMVVPVLECYWVEYEWWRVVGHLYLVEPVAWVPQVHHTDTIPASNFTGEYENTSETIKQTEFNAGVSAELSVTAGGSYWGVTVQAKASSNVEYKYSTKTVTTESIKKSGITGQTPILKLLVYPNLKCKVIKQQRMEYTIDGATDVAQLKFPGCEDVHNNEHWDRLRVEGSRVDHRNIPIINPVPMTGNTGLADQAYLCPIFSFSSGGGEVEVNTLISRRRWKEYYYYDSYPWESKEDQTILVAVPNNDVAFPPMVTWTDLVKK